MGRTLGFLGLSLLVLTWPVACGLDAGGNFAEDVHDATSEGASALDAAADATADGTADGAGGSDATVETGVDAGADTAPTPDAASITCTGGPPLVNDCLQCSGKPTRCPATNTCVSDCHNGGCAGAPIQCFSCDGSNRPTTSACAPTGAAACAGFLPRCMCPAGDRTLCAGRYQTCGVGDICLSCGEAATNGNNCKGGNSCDTGGGSDQFTCH
jgi:hypothetical protein